MLLNFFQITTYVDVSFNKMKFSLKKMGSKNKIFKKNLTYIQKRFTFNTAQHNLCCCCYCCFLFLAQYNAVISSRNCSIGNANKTTKFYAFRSFKTIIEHILKCFYPNSG